MLLVPTVLLSILLYTRQVILLTIVTTVSPSADFMPRWGADLFLFWDMLKYFCGYMSMGLTGNIEVRLRSPTIPAIKDREVLLWTFAKRKWRLDAAWATALTAKKNFFDSTSRFVPGLIFPPGVFRLRAQRGYFP